MGNKKEVIEKEQNTLPTEEIDKAAVLSLFVYGEAATNDSEDKSIGNIVTNFSDPNGVAVNNITSLSENADIANMELIDQSEIALDSNGNNLFNTDYITACTFRDPETGDIYICYRGTGDKQWMDNAEAISSAGSVMQEEAVAYFDYIYEKYGSDANRIIVAGHSKGGNEAQYVTLNSKYAEEIDACYSFDGQGHSQETIDAVIAEKGMDFYEAQRQKMYSICGDSDLVRGLGHVIIPEENTYYIKTGFPFSSLLDCHDLRGMLGENGINWTYDVDGDVVSVEQQWLGIMSEELAQNLNGLSDEDYEDCVMSVMYFLELADNNENLGAGERSCATPEEMIGCLCNGGPVVIFTMLSTPEGRESLGNMYFALHTVMGPNAIPAFFFLMLLALYFVALCPVIENVSDFVDSVMHELEKVIRMAEPMYAEVMQDMFIVFYNYMNALSFEMLGQANYGSLYAGLQEHIKVDTYKLREYAERLKAIDEKVEELDRRIEALYHQTQWRELKSIIHTGSLAGQRWKLKQCIAYLIETAEDFEAAEEDILQALGAS